MLNVVPLPRKFEPAEGCCARTEVKGSFDAGIPDEGYRLEITPEGVTAFASGKKGFFYAARTLGQLETEKGFPCGTLEDWPEYPHRGFLVDCARHFIPLPELKRLIDCAAVFKFNRFHWHLADDQGWRVQLDCYPQLTGVGSRRERSHFGRRAETGPHEGFYTKAEIADVVAFCAERYIEVIPEIDLPGHSSALLAALPQLGCEGVGAEIKCTGGVFEDIVCAGREENFAVLERILGELCEMFPGREFHIGGDEAPKTRWERCPDCQRRILKLGFSDEEQLHGWFAGRLAEFLKTRGKTATVWNEALDGDNLPTDVTVQFWMGDRERLARHCEAGGKAVVSDFFSYYMDYPYGITPLEKTLDFDPSLNGIKNIIGVEAAVWTEHISDAARLQYLCWPRFAAVAEAGWCGRGQQDFEKRVEPALAVLARKGTAAAPRRDWNMDGLRGWADKTRFWLDAINGDTVRLFLRQRRLSREKAEKLALREKGPEEDKTGNA